MSEQLLIQCVGILHYTTLILDTRLVDTFNSEIPSVSQLALQSNTSSTLWLRLKQQTKHCKKHTLCTLGSLLRPVVSSAATVLILHGLHYYYPRLRLHTSSSLLCIIPFWSGKSDTF